MKTSKSCAVFIFIGALLIVIFVVGLIVEKYNVVLSPQYRYDLALEHFGAFCSNYWIPAGIIGIPMFLVTLVVSLIREKKGKEQ